MALSRRPRVKSREPASAPLCRRKPLVECAVQEDFLRLRPMNFLFQEHVQRGHIGQRPRDRELRRGTEAGIHNGLHGLEHVRAVTLVDLPDEALPSVFGVQRDFERTAILVRLQHPKAHRRQSLGPTGRPEQPMQLGVEVTLGQRDGEPQGRSGELALGLHHAGNLVSGARETRTDIESPMPMAKTFTPSSSSGR